MTSSKSPSTARKVYLGDGVYAVIDSRGLSLTVNDGSGEVEVIILTEAAWMTLKAFVANAQRATREDF